MPTYMLVLHDDPKAFSSGIGPAEMQAVLEEYRAWGAKMAEQGRLKGGEKLKDEGGVQMRREQGKVRVVDGPFAEAKEVFGGFYLIEGDSYAHVVDLCRDHPQLKYGLRIDIREIDSV